MNDYKYAITVGNNKKTIVQQIWQCENISKVKCIWDSISILDE